MKLEPGVKADHTALGIGLILVSVLMMAFADALVKLISANVTVWQVFVVRSAVAIVLLYGTMRVVGGSARVTSVRWVSIRSALLVVTWLAFYASLPVLDLSVAAVAVYTNPIMIALMSALVIGEAVTRRQWIGVLMGFAGVIAILRPGTDDFSWAIVLPLIAAATYASAMVLTRSHCQGEAPLALALVLHVGFLAAGLIASAVLAVIGLDAATQATFPFLLGDWAAMGAREWGLLVLLGALAAAYFSGVAKAYQIAPPSVIATFDYAYLVSAALWGYVLFAERPDALTIAGMVLITVSGLLVAAPRRRRATAA